MYAFPHLLKAVEAVVFEPRVLTALTLWLSLHLDLRDDGGFLG